MKALFLDLFVCSDPTLAASKATLVGHQSEVTCVLVSSELGIIVSGSKGESSCFMLATDSSFHLVFMGTDFRNVITNAPTHVPSHLLPPKRKAIYSLRPRTHAICATIQGQMQLYLTVSKIW